MILDVFNTTSTFNTTSVDALSDYYSYEHHIVLYKIYIYCGNVAKRGSVVCSQCAVIVQYSQEKLLDL